MAIKIPDNAEIYKIEVPLSPQSESVVLISSSHLTNSDFSRLHKALYLMEESLLGNLTGTAHTHPDPSTAIPETPHLRKPRVLQQLPPCHLHPQALRHEKSNECLVCLRLRLQEAREMKKKLKEESTKSSKVG